MLKFAPKRFFYPLKNRSQCLAKHMVYECFYSHHHSRSSRNTGENFHFSVSKKIWFDQSFVTQLFKKAVLLMTGFLAASTSNKYICYENNCHVYFLSIKYSVFTNVYSLWHGGLSLQKAYWPNRPKYHCICWGNLQMQRKKTTGLNDILSYVFIR